MKKKSKSKIPVYIELRKYNHESSKRRNLIDFIYEEMKLSKFELDMDMFEYMVDKGRFLFLFDAYDEITSDKAQFFLQEFEDFLKRYDENQVIISSRNMPNGNLENFIDLHELQTKGLSKQEAIGLVKKTKYDEERKKFFIASLSKNLYEEYETLACNPTLLLLMLTLFSTSTNFPKEKSTFLIKAFEELFDKHDGRKIAYTRDFKCKSLTKYQMMTIFSFFCFRSYFDTNGEKDAFSEEYVKDCLEKAFDKYKFLDSKIISIEDILYDFRVCLCIIYKEGEKYYFVHNIFQEFFSAYYIYKSNAKKQKAFIKKYLFSETNLKRYNTRLIRTTLDYLIELDSSEEQTAIKFNFVLPILEMIEHEPKFTDYHQQLDYLRCKFSAESCKYEIYLKLDVSILDNVAYNSLVRLYLLGLIKSTNIRSMSKKLTRKELKSILQSSRFKELQERDILDGRLGKINTSKESRGIYSVEFTISYSEMCTDKNLIPLKELYDSSSIFRMNETFKNLYNELKTEKSEFEDDDDI